MSITSIVWSIIGLALALFILALIISSRYRSLMKFKFLRKYIKWSLFFKKLNAKMAPREYGPLSPLQEKAIKLWKLCIKDKSTELRSSFFDKVRQIDKDNLMLILRHASNDYYLLTILDFDSIRNNCYEVQIPRSYIDNICDLFDVEMSRRMRAAENIKREILGDDLDKLISNQEKILKAYERRIKSGVNKP